MVKEKWIWDNIMDIYLKMGKDYTHKDIIEITSHDNYFKCVLFYDNGILMFTISIENSLLNETKYSFKAPNYIVMNTEIDKIDFYIEKLKPIFREYKLKELL